MPSFCRLCAEIKDPAELVTSIEDNDQLIEAKLITCCQWSPQCDELDLPKEICVLCLQTLEKCWQFSQSVQLAQRKLVREMENAKAESTFPAKSIPTSLECNICLRSFKSASGLEAHTRKLNQPSCAICSQVFCSIKALQAHSGHCGDEKEKESENGDPTNESNANDDSQRQNLTHESETDGCNSDNETKCEEYSCYICSKSFKKFPLLKYHMHVHTLLPKYKCQYCKRKFRTMRQYSSHQQKHIDYYCDICLNKYSSAHALKVHRRMHEGASVKMHGCKECDHFFLDISKYCKHMRTRHGMDKQTAKEKAIIIEPNGTSKPYVCEQCGKDFMDNSSLEAHLAIHLDVRPYQCKICPKAFKNKYNLKTHVEAHAGLNAVTCAECGKTFSRKSVLLRHMGEHTGVFPNTFQCDYCDRTFRSMYNMQNHRRTHTGEKPYICFVCRRCTTTKTQMERHLKSKSHLEKLSKSK